MGPIVHPYPFLALLGGNAKSLLIMLENRYKYPRPSHPLDAILKAWERETLPPFTPQKKMQALPIPSQQIKKLEQEAHAAQVRAILLANAKTRRGY